jgi:hypothetical protein
MLKIAPATMKIPILSTLFVATVFLCGCSSTKFTEYHGSEVFQGTGGSVRVVDGIDFWENGDSNRKYKILGVIDESHKHGYLPGRFNRLFSDSGDRESAIAKVAHKQGGDAVVSWPEIKSHPVWISLAMGITGAPQRRVFESMTSSAG